MQEHKNDKTKQNKTKAWKPQVFQARDFELPRVKLQSKLLEG